MLFDEEIPERSADYFEELNRATIRDGPELTSKVSDYTHLVGQYHAEGGLVFVNSRVSRRNGEIVGYRAMLTGDKKTVEDKRPIPIGKMQRMTTALARRLEIAQSKHRDGGGEVVKSTGKTCSPHVDKPDLAAGGNTPSTQVGAKTGGQTLKRGVRQDASILTEVNAISDPAIVQLLMEADEAWFTDEYEKEPESHAEALRCTDAEHWRKAREDERASLRAKKVFTVTLIPEGVRPIKAKYVYKRKFTKEGILKKYKARLVALGYGQVDGVDVFNTYAPVVKGVTV